jgi:hypothetical protein
MQVSVGSGYHIGKSKLRIPKTGLTRLRYESNTTKRSPKTIVSRGVVIPEPKGHVIPLARHGRDGLINETVGSDRAGLETEGPRVLIKVNDKSFVGLSAVGPRW